MAKKDAPKDADLAKTIKALGTSVQEEMDAMDEDDLRAAIVAAEAVIRETDAVMNDDEKLNGAKELVKDLGSGYRDAKKAQKAKTKYALFLLDQKGLLT